MLKGQYHEIFCFWYFSWISFHPAPEYSIKTISSRKFAEIFAIQGAPPVSMTPVANNGSKVSKRNHKNFSDWRFFPICHRCRWHRWQTLICEYLREKFEKIWNSPNGIIRGLGETNSWKKTRNKKSRDTVPLKILSSQKRGGYRGVSIDSFQLPTPSLIFFWTLKGLIFWFKSQKTDFSVQGQKRWNLFWYGFRYQKLCGVVRHCATFIGSDRRRITWKLLWWDQ